MTRHFFRIMYRKRIAQGLCGKCGGPKDTYTNNCAECLHKERGRMNATRGYEGDFREEREETSMTTSLNLLRNSYGGKVLRITHSGPGCLGRTLTQAALKRHNIDTPFGFGILAEGPGVTDVKIYND